jgi:hypothetical protein
MQEFENLRELFVSPDYQEEYFLPLPESLNRLHVPNRKIYNGELRITG